MFGLGTLSGRHARSGSVCLLYLAKGLCDISHVVVATIRKTGDEVHFAIAGFAARMGFQVPGGPGELHAGKEARDPRRRERGGHADRLAATPARLVVRFRLLRAEAAEGPRHVGGVAILP